MKTFFLKATFSCLLLLLFNFEIIAQLNLVQDASFEDTTNTVNGLGQLSLKNWRNLDSNFINKSPFSYCSLFSQNVAYLLPTTQWFYQYPRSGNGCSAFDIVWSLDPFYKRSLARIKLSKILTSGNTYCAKLFVNPCEKSFCYFTDAFQMYFDNGQLDTIIAIDSVGPYTFVNPQVSNPVGNIINDTVGWTLISGTFVANGTEEFLTIGNFKSDAGSAKVFNPSAYVPPDTIYASGMLVDDVSVIPINAANWLHDTSCILGDSVYIGLPEYEYPDGMWYDLNMNFLKKGSGLKVKPTQWATKYIMQIDLCGIIRSDTLTVWAAPDGIEDLEGKRDIEVYPNPAKNVIDIKCMMIIGGSTKVEMYNSVGELVKSISLLSRRIKIDVSDLPKGVYFLKCEGIIKKVIID